MRTPQRTDLPAASSQVRQRGKSGPSGDLKLQHALDILSQFTQPGVPVSLETAKALSIMVPHSLTGRTDELRIVAVHESGVGPSRQLAATQQFGCFWGEADIGWAVLTEPDL